MCIYLSPANPSRQGFFFFYSNIAYWVWKQIILHFMNNQNVLEKHLLSWLLFPYISIISEKSGRTERERENDFSGQTIVQITLFYKKLIHKVEQLPFQCSKTYKDMSYHSHEKTHGNTVSPRSIFWSTCGRVYLPYINMRGFCSETLHSLINANFSDINNLLIYSLLKPDSHFLVNYGTCQEIPKYIIEPSTSILPSNDEYGENILTCCWLDI